MSQTISWRVSGMTCRSCEKNISTVLAKHPEVEWSEVSLRLARVTVRLANIEAETVRQALNEDLKVLGYVLWVEGCERPAVNRSPFDARLRRAVGAIALAFVAAWAFVPAVQRVVPSVSATASVGAMFFLGVVASLSTCLASTGGFLLAYAAGTSTVRRSSMVHLGRMTAFILGGAALGAIGGALPAWSPAWYGGMALVLGIGFLGVALNLLDLMPSWSSLGLSLPASFARAADQVQTSDRAWAPFLVGATTFVLPCGFTQTAQALALASGSPLRGAAILGAFALGTLPVLAGLTSFASKARVAHPTLRTAAGAVIFLFAMGQFQSGAAVLGVSAPDLFDAPTTAVSAQAHEQVVNMEVNGYGYWPASFTLKKGVPVRWEVFAKDIGGCTDILVSRELNISKRLEKGLNEFTFTPTKTGKIAFSCGMGMVRGSFTVIN